MRIVAFITDTAPCGGFSPTSASRLSCRGSAGPRPARLGRPGHRGRTRLGRPGPTAARVRLRPAGTVVAPFRRRHPPLTRRALQEFETAGDLLNEMITILRQVKRSRPPPASGRRRGDRLLGGGGIRSAGGAHAPREVATPLSDGLGLSRVSPIPGFPAGSPQRTTKRGCCAILLSEWVAVSRMLATPRPVASSRKPSPNPGISSEELCYDVPF